MTTKAECEALVKALDDAVQDVLGYFAGAGRASTARVDQWQARDVLQHFIYFHDATAWGIQSVALGGPVWPVPGDSDHMNEVWRRLRAHESYDELLAQTRLAHGRLMEAVRSVTPADLDTPCFARANGQTLTGAQRLELLAKHWREHVHELQAAEAGGPR